jgi:ethanolamine utilization protein EutN
MFLARVTGNIVCTAKDKTLGGQKLLVVEPLNVQYDESRKPTAFGNTGRAIVAIDVVGCGEGQLVLVVQGSSARMTEQTAKLPADAVIVGIVDSAVIDSRTFYKA